jgi:hypothetical protein
MTDEVDSFDFEEWVSHIFDRPLGESRYSPAGSDEVAERWKADPLGVTALLTRLFEQSAFLCDRFSIAQINQGFQCICAQWSSWIGACLAPSVPPQHQVRLIRAIYPLYRDCFSIMWPRLSVAVAPKGLPSVCFAFWDHRTICRAASSPHYTYLAQPMLDVVRSIMQLDSLSCQISVLSACSYLHQYHRRQIEATIAFFLQRHPRLHADIRRAADTIMRQPQRPTRVPLTYRDWLDYVFDRPVEEDQWYWQEDEEGDPLDWWKPAPLVIANYMTQLFEHPEALVDRYSDEQINQGLWFIMGVSNFMYHQTALDDIVPFRVQERWIRSLLSLYSSLFAERCAEYFGHCDDGPELARPLNSACYMLWDMGNLYEVATSIWYRHLVTPVFDVLEQVLSLDALACRESSLHALGHIQDHHPQRVAGIIDQFLRSAEPGDPRLCEYAEHARAGQVH